MFDSLQHNCFSFTPFITVYKGSKPHKSPSWRMKGFLSVFDCCWVRTQDVGYLLEHLATALNARLSNVYTKFPNHLHSILVLVYLCLYVCATTWQWTFVQKSWLFERSPGQSRSIINMVKIFTAIV